MLFLVNIFTVYGVDAIEIRTDTASHVWEFKFESNVVRYLVELLDALLAIQASRAPSFHAHVWSTAQASFNCYRCRLQFLLINSKSILLEWWKRCAKKTIIHIAQLIREQWELLADDDDGALSPNMAYWIRIAHHLMSTQTLSSSLFISLRLFWLFQLFYLLVSV